MSSQDDHDAFGATMDFPALVLPPTDRPRSSDGEFMADLVDASDLVRKYLAMAAAVIPDKALDVERYPVLAGHAVRLFKLYDSFVYLIVDQRAEIAMILLRALSETAINLAYLLDDDNHNLIQAYRKASLAYEKRVYDEIDKLKQTPPLPIERRMQQGIERAVARAGLTLEEISWKDKDWGGNAYEKAQHTDLIGLYDFGFRPMSHHVHGTWHDLEFHHLEQKANKYHPCLRYTQPKPQLFEMPTIVCLRIMQRYLQVVAPHQATEMDKRLDILAKWFRDMLNLHEQFLTTK